MFIEQIALFNFRCFGPNGTSIKLTPNFTIFIGSNGSGKTAVMQGMQRLFGVTDRQRRICRQDFHIPASEQIIPQQRTLALEVILAFPELDNDSEKTAIPEFFNQMAATKEGKLKCRLRLEANFTDDGTLEGAIEQKYFCIRSLGNYTEGDCIELKAVDRSRIQLIYVPASRDGTSQVTSFLRGRLWRAVNWSPEVREAIYNTGSTINGSFNSEAAVKVIELSLKDRWQEVHTAGTYSTPTFRPLDLRFEEFIRKVEVIFHPDEAGRDRALEDLSDGQRSLFHLAMTAAALDVEQHIITTPNTQGFQQNAISLPSLTLIAVEEPENNLSPFYLSRILSQMYSITQRPRAQAIISSHSPSILSRIDPTSIRHFRLNECNRSSQVNTIRLPPASEDASKYIREAVRTYPELYFARFVVLGEGASEEVVLPRLAEAMGLKIDPSFVAVVPLGGRHVNHLWRLLTDLNIPYATLLDLDFGREGGGWGRVKTACKQLLDIGVPPEKIFATPNINDLTETLNYFDKTPSSNFSHLADWTKSLRNHNVYFCSPLDLDYSMLKSFPTAYQIVEKGKKGPSDKGDPRTAVLGEEGDSLLYPADQDQLLRWYRYLFLGRGKPSTHVRVLSSLSQEELALNAPEELKALLTYIQDRLQTSTC